jgi:hypothetical protein
MHRDLRRPTIQTLEVETRNGKKINWECMPPGRPLPFVGTDYYIIFLAVCSETRLVEIMENLCAKEKDDDEKEDMATKRVN